MGSMRTSGLALVLLAAACATSPDADDAAGPDGARGDARTVTDARSADAVGDGPSVDALSDAPSGETAADASALDATRADASAFDGATRPDAALTDAAPTDAAPTDAAPTDAAQLDAAHDAHADAVTDASADGGAAFVLGTTVPDATNTGVLPGVARTGYTGPSTITTGNQTFRNLDFHTLIIVRAANVTFENCFFHGGATAPATNTALVDCRGPEVHGVVFDRCSFSPSDPSVWTDAVIGHDFTANRCFTEHTVDGFGVYNAYSAALNVHLTGNDVADMSRYDDDPNHTDGTGTHNDCVQLQGGQGLWAIGNAFHAYTWYEGDPARAVIPIGHSVLTQYNAYFPVGDIHVNQNFMYGGRDGLRFFSQRGPGVGGGYQGYAVEAVDNVWMDDDQTDFGGSLHWYTLRTDSNITLNGRIYPTTGGTDDTHGNRYGTGSTVDAARRGLPIKVRCDAFPAP